MEGQFYAGMIAAVIIGGLVWYILKRKKETDARTYDPKPRPTYKDREELKK